MKKFIAALLGLSFFGAPVLAEDPRNWLPSNSAAALGCMKLRDCKDGVTHLTNYNQFEELFGKEWLEADKNQEEVALLITFLELVGVELFIADNFYFPAFTRGMYYTDVNRLFLNKRYMADPEALIEVIRHEGWHASQDCMAGTIKNSSIAVIFLPEEIPQDYKLLARLRYTGYAERAVPWEQEAIWAGDVEFMTVRALTACRAGEMWKVYEPTPLTKEWLVKKGYIKN